MIAYPYNEPAGQTWEIGAAWWAYPIALSAQKVLISIGLAYSLDTVVGWISGAFSSPEQALASGDAISDATRAYYLEVLDSWAQAAAVKVDPARMTFLAPVLNRAAQVIQDPTVEHGTIQSTIKAVAVFVEQQAEQSGTPLAEPDPAAPPPPPPPPGVPLPSPLPYQDSARLSVAEAGPGAWIALGAVAVGFLYLWRESRGS